MILVMLGIFLIGMAIGVSVVVTPVPQGFNLDLPTLPFVSGQMFGICDYDGTIVVDEINVWSNTIDASGEGFLKYSTSLKNQYGVDCYEVISEIHYFGDPVQAMEDDLAIQIQNAIVTPPPVPQPIATGTAT